MHGPLTGRTAIITGAGRGIGAATARALSRAGASVVLADRDDHALEALATEIASAGGHAVAVHTDLADPVSVRRLVEQTLGAFGRLDLVLLTSSVDNGENSTPGSRIIAADPGGPLCVDLSPYSSRQS